MAASTPLPSSRFRRFLVQVTGQTEALYVTLSGRALVQELKGARAAA